MCHPVSSIQSHTYFGLIKKQQVVKVIWQQAALPPYMDGSVVFTRWRQCASHLIRDSLGPPESKFHTASRSVQPFLHSSQQRVAILYNGPPPPTQNCPSYGGYEPPNNTWFLGPTRLSIPKSISISSAVFAGLTTVTHRQINRPRYLVCNNSPHLRA